MIPAKASGDLSGAAYTYYDAGVGAGWTYVLNASWSEWKCRNIGFSHLVFKNVFERRVRLYPHLDQVNGEAALNTINAER